MNQFIHILLIFFISSGLTSCALNRAKSENMLEVCDRLLERGAQLDVQDSNMM